ncbi:MAG: hypothetical protein RBT73_04635 [Spirochaetia bacterium]|jgi:hypothetical protein|nr:hypothetical protein [Spirochaetia bacterium]
MLSEALKTADWSSAPQEMEFQCSYRELLESIFSDSALLRRAWEQQGSYSAEDIQKAIRLYIRTPGIVNVMLNYKICVEHGLPLHPSVYYELKEARKYKIDHGLPVVENANRLYRQSMLLAREVLALDNQTLTHGTEFLARLPRDIKSFIYTGIRDTYTWKGSEPAILQRLAEKLRKDYDPEIIIAAAHGAIMPALLLAELLKKPLYCIRFSMFKRHDEEPIISFSDKAWLSEFSSRRAILYDEDVAGGRTLDLFARRLAPLFSQTKTACSIRHAGSSIRPDFVGLTWWD